MADARGTKPHWHRDILVCALLCILCSALLIFRAIRDPFSSPGYPFQDVFVGIKFYGHAAHITMTIQAIAFAAFGIGILLHQRWGLILVLLYFAEVVTIEGPIVFLIGAESMSSSSRQPRDQRSTSPIFGAFRSPPFTTGCFGKTTQFLSALSMCARLFRDQSDCATKPLLR